MNIRAHFIASTLRPLLIPVIPPEGPLNESAWNRCRNDHERDNLTKSLGKAPGVWKRDAWHLLNEWQKGFSDDAAMHLCAMHGCNLGLRMGVTERPLYTADVDIENVSIAHRVREAIEAKYGKTACRSRDNSGKFALIYSTHRPFVTTHRQYVDPETGEILKIDLLGKGSQLVIGPMHQSGHAYVWSCDPSDPVAFTNLEVAAPDVLMLQLDKLMLELGYGPLGSAPKSDKVAAAMHRPVEHADAPDGWRFRCGSALIKKLAEKKPVGERSEQLWSGIHSLLDVGFTPAETMAILLQFPDGIADKVNGRNPDRWLWPQIVKADAERREEWEREKEEFGDGAVVDLDFIGRLNQRYAVVNEGGSVVVFEKTIQDERIRYQSMTFDDLRRAHWNRRVQSGKKRITIADAWFEHEARMEYLDGVVFDPSGKEIGDGVLNLWQGWAFTPSDAGTWDRMREHLFENICSGNQEWFDYLLKWTARLFQHPASPGEVAVVLRGGRGAGKGAFANCLRRLCGQHGMAISNSDHLTGRFNGHLRDCVFLFADEAFFAGDKRHESVLKTLITEPTLVIEEKYKAASASPNYIHLLMASNEGWVVPAGEDERRYFVLEVGSERQRDLAYFNAIFEELDNGGYAAMLHDLMTLDLTGFDVRREPDTGALRGQKEMSLPSEALWLRDVLMRGYVWDSDLAYSSLMKWLPEVSTSLLTSSYLDFCARHRTLRPKNSVHFGRYLSQIFKSKRLFGQVAIKEVSVKGEAHTIHSNRPTGYVLGSIGDARRAFDRHHGLTTDWGADEAPIVKMTSDFDDEDWLS